MKKFSYIAKDSNGKKMKGLYMAESEAQLRENLAKSNLFVVSVKQLSTKAASSFFSITGKVSVVELSNFCKQFSTMVSAGISIIDSINILKEQSYSQMFKKTLNKIADDLTTGTMLSEAMKKHKKVFPDFFCSMVYIGETSGGLDQVLVGLSNYYIRTTANKKKVIASMTYPITITVIMIAVVAVLMHFVIPTFISTFMQMDIEMPALTMAMFNISQFFQKNWKYLILGAILIGVLIYLSSKTQKGRYFIDKMKVTIPGIKRINIALFTSKLCQSLGLLLSSGLDVLSALQSISNIINNKYLEKQYAQVINDVKKGMSLSGALELEMKLSPVLTQMIFVGEKTGKVDSILMQTYTFFDMEVENAINALTSAIQPTVLAILGGVIAVMFMAMYMPILSMITSIKPY